MNFNLLLKFWIGAACAVCSLSDIIYAINNLLVMETKGSINFTLILAFYLPWFDNEVN